MSLSPATSRRLVVVCGKGGVGRTTLAAVLASKIASQGRRTALVEVHGAGGQRALWGAAPPLGEPARLADGLDLIALDAAACLTAYIADRRASAPLAGAVLRGRVLAPLLDALPGFADLVHLGMTRGLLDERVGGRPPYDTVVLDAPPTGHGLALTATARAMAEMTASGPIHDECVAIAARLEDPAHTAQIWVSLAGALPVSELAQGLDALGPQRDTVAALVLNRVEADPLGSDAAWTTARAGLAPGWVGVGDRLNARLEAQRQARRALRGLAAGLPVWELPAAEASLGPAAIARLAALDLGVAA